MLLSDVLNKFNEKYEKYNEPDNNEITGIDGDINRDYQLDNKLDNRESIPSNYEHDINHDIKDSNRTSYSYDNQDPDFKDAYQRNIEEHDLSNSDMLLDDAIVKEHDLSNSDIILDDNNTNGKINYDNETEYQDDFRPKIDYHNKLAEKVDEFKLKPEIDHDNGDLIDGKTDPLRSDVEAYLNNPIGIHANESEDVLKEKIEKFSKKYDENATNPDLKYAEYNHNIDYDVSETYHENKDWEERHLNNPDKLSKMDDDSEEIKRLKAKQDELDSKMKQKIYPNPSEHKFTRAEEEKEEFEEHIPSGKNYKKNDDIKMPIDNPMYFHEFDNYLSNTTGHATFREMVEGTISNFKKSVIDTDFSSIKEQFFENTANAISDSIDNSFSHLNLEVDKIARIKDQFINSTLNLAQDITTISDTIGRESLNQIEEDLMWKIYTSPVGSVLKGITNPLSLLSRNKNGHRPNSNQEAPLRDTAGLDLYTSEKDYLSYELKPREKIKDYDGKKQGKTDHYGANRDGYISLETFLEPSIKPLKFTKDTKHYNLLDLDNNFKSVENAIKTKEKSTGTFKGYKSIQETFKYGVATDYYWDLTIEPYINTSNPITGIPLPFNGGWFPVKSFDIGQDYLNGEQLSAGDMQIKILTTRYFPRTITINVIEDFFRQIEMYGRMYNRVVSQINEQSMCVLPIDKQAFKINIVYLMPNYQMWKKVSYIGIPEFKTDMKGTEEKQRKEYSILFNIIGLADYESNGSSQMGFGYFYGDSIKPKKRTNNL